jgi:poly(A) polymerase
MTQTLTPIWFSWPEVKTLTQTFAKHKVPLRFVGGCVRDALLDITAGDIDAATPLAPEHVIDVLQTENIKAIPTGIEHGTITAVIGKKSFEITTLRKDTACDGRHAAVEYTEHWEEDARRRDFTINAFYLTPEGELFDYHHGRADLEKHQVRFIGKADDRIQEDYLRILRFFRFYARYAKGAPDHEAMIACKKHAPQLAMLSGERISQEMLKLLAAAKPSAALLAMQETELLGRVIPRAEVENVIRLEIIEQKAEIAPQAELRLAVLMAHASDKDIDLLSSRWKLSNALSQHLAQVVSLSQYIRPDLSLAEQKKSLRRSGAGLYSAAVLVAAAKDKNGEAYLTLFELPKQWTPPEFPLSGADLKSQGMAEGKALGNQLRALEDAWEESDYVLSKAQLLKKLN